MSSHEHRIVKIALCSTMKLGNHEIHGRQNMDSKARLMNEIDSAIPISRRHGHGEHHHAIRTENSAVMVDCFSSAPPYPSLECQC